MQWNQLVRKNAETEDDTMLPDAEPIEMQETFDQGLSPVERQELENVLTEASHLKEDRTTLKPLSHVDRARLKTDVFYHNHLLKYYNPALI